jgi:hypothetical protein
MGVHGGTASLARRRASCAPSADAAPWLRAVRSGARLRANVAVAARAMTTVAMVTTLPPLLSVTAGRRRADEATQADGRLDAR